MKSSALIEKAAEDIGFGPSRILINDLFGPKALDTPIGVFINVVCLFGSMPVTLPLLAIAEFLKKRGL